MTYIDLKLRADLVTLYSEKQRHYHTLEHVYDCLVKLEEYSSAVQLGEHMHDMIEAALWFHDAVYIPKSKKNEQNSAGLFMLSLGGRIDMARTTVNTIYNAILCTKTHTPRNQTEQVVCDIDLSILGASRKDYEKYQFDITKEYNFVPFDKFIIGRRTFLNGMLQKSEIFSLDYFKNLYEKQARENMEWELTFLK